MSSLREALAALERLKTGTTTLTPEGYHGLLEAVEQAFHTLQLAPTGSDPVATGLWYNHERTPALARLAEALAPPAGGPEQGASRALADQQATDRQVIRELHRSLVDRTEPPRRPAKR